MVSSRCYSCPKILSNVFTSYLLLRLALVGDHVQDIVAVERHS